MDDVNRIGQKIQEILYQHGAVSINEASPRELYRALGYFVREELGRQMYLTDQTLGNGVTLVYLSMEYLPGSILEKNIDYLGIREELKKALEEYSYDLEDLLYLDGEIGLGYGDLGYLSNALLDTFASYDYNAISYGLLYRDGYFSQIIKDYEQVEELDTWWNRGKNWLYKGENVYTVETGGKVNVSVGEKGLIFKQVDTDKLNLQYYDLPYVGYKNGRCQRLRLFDHEKLTRNFYPKSSSPEDLRNRFQQEYLLVSGAVSDVIKQHLEMNRELDSLGDNFLFLLMDSSLLIAIPEFMRVLVDIYKMEWDDAWRITAKMFFFTPLLSLPDAMLTLDSNMFREWLPRLWMILEEIHHRYLRSLDQESDLKGEDKSQATILWDDKIRLINIAKAGAHQGPPVGYPLAISHRRWLVSGNQRLKDLLFETIGDGFITEPRKVLEILNLKEDKTFIDKLEDVRYKNKERLSKRVFLDDRIILNPHSIFDGYLNEISTDNRQLLLLLSIIDSYLSLKDNPNLDIVPKVFFIGGKAGRKNLAGKEIIRLTLRLQEVINKDITIKDKLKMVFIPDLSLKKGEYVYPSIDINESLITPSKGDLHIGGLTSMINGAVSLASKDDTNLMIRDKIGSDNIKVFGITEEEVKKEYHTKSYNSHEVYYLNKDVKRAVDTLLGREGLFNNNEFRLLYELLLKYNDHNFVMKDFLSYKNAREQLENEYLDSEVWIRKVISNIALIGEFSSDVVVDRYRRVMWQSNKGE